jgi:hypothetical protein
MPQITTDTGTVNLERTSARVLVFHCPLRSQDKERALSAVAADKAYDIERRGWQAERPAVAKRRFAGAARVPMDMKAYGSMRTTNFDVPSGTIIKVFAQVANTWAADGRASTITANRYYLVRDGAAMLDVRIKMSKSPDCIQQYSQLLGPLEPLSVEEAVALGVKRQPEAFLRSCYRQEDADFLITETQLAPARSTVTIVTAPPTADGAPAAGAAVVLPTARRRKLGTT